MKNYESCVYNIPGNGQDICFRKTMRKSTSQEACLLTVGFHLSSLWLGYVKALA